MKRRYIDAVPRRLAIIQTAYQLQVLYKVRDVMTCTAVAGVHRQDKGVYPTETHTTQYAGSVHLSSGPAKPLSCLTARSMPFSGPPIDYPVGSNEASVSLS